MNDTNNSELGAQENIPSTDSDRPASNSIEGHSHAEKLDVTGADSIGEVDKQIAVFLNDGFLDDSELTALDSHLDGYYDHPPPDTRAENVKHLRTSVVKRTELEATKGPIPPPRILAGYETAVQVPGNRILAMAESQHAHRHSIEAKVVDANIEMERRGPMFGGLIALVAIISSIVLIAIGKSVEGMAIVIGELVALVAVFIKAQSSSKKELSSKQAQADSNKID